MKDELLELEGIFASFGDTTEYDRFAIFSDDEFTKEVEFQFEKSNNSIYQDTKDNSWITESN